MRPYIIIFNFARIIEQVKNKKMELSKKDRKVARQIIEDGLQKEFGKGLDKIDKVLKKWKEEKQDNRESYHLLFKTIKDFDKHIAKRYDNMTG